MKFKPSERGQELVLYGIVIAVVLLLAWCADALLSLPNRITDDRAMPRIAEIAEVQQSDIVIIHKTNDSPWTGDTHDVSYELEIEGVRQSARCSVTGWWSDMVCRVYSGPE